jgi:hypothetical protein
MRAHGYIVNGAYEADTAQCRHCDRHFVVAVGTQGAPENAGWCGRCAHVICGRCAQEMAETLRCRPFELRLEQYEARMAARRAMEHALGG